MKKKEDKRDREKKASNLRALWVFSCRGWRANGGMVENSNVSVSVGSPALCAESIAHHNIQSCVCWELMKCVSCGGTFLTGTHRDISVLATSNGTEKATVWHLTFTTLTYSNKAMQRNAQLFIENVGKGGGDFN